MSMFRYYAAKATGKDLVPVKVSHTTFLRTGLVAPIAENWVKGERRFLSPEEVAERTGIQLENTGKKTHQRLNNFHKSLSFPKIIFHKTLAAAPHLGYVHVTASKTDFAEYKDVSWAFYIANFSAEITADITADEQFFNRISPGYSRMYFAMAMKDSEDGKTRQQVINRDVRDNGVLFKTGDPKTAFKNVLLLRAKSAELRKIIEAAG